MRKRKRADPLREKDYDLPIGKILKRELVKNNKSYKSQHIGIRRPRSGGYEYKYEFVKSHGEDISSNLRLRRGDIAYVNETKSAPKFMHSQFVVVLDRYRIVKHKYNDFYDYGAILMVLTGPNKGKVGKAFGCLGNIQTEMINNLKREIENDSEKTSS